MSVRKSSAKWTGNLKRGSGTMDVGSGAYTGPYTFASRFENGDGTNPEELIGAAHAGCYSMALSNILDGAGFSPNSVETTAEVTLGEDSDGPAITEIKLITEADVPDIDEATFRQHAEAAKEGCPVSKALSATAITLDARLR